MALESRLRISSVSQCGSLGYSSRGAIRRVPGFPARCFDPSPLLLLFYPSRLFDRAFPLPSTRSRSHSTRRCPCFTASPQNSRLPAPAPAAHYCTLANRQTRRTRMSQARSARPLLLVRACAAQTNIHGVRSPSNLNAAPACRLPQAPTHDPTWFLRATHLQRLTQSGRRSYHCIIAYPRIHAPKV